jgi:hypothetical protein
MLKCMNLALGYEVDSEGKLIRFRFCAGFRVCSRNLLFLDAHAKLRGMTVSFVTPFSPSVCQSARHNTAHTYKDFHEIFYWWIF